MFSFHKVSPIRNSPLNSYSNIHEIKDILIFTRKFTLNEQMSIFVSKNTLMESKEDYVHFSIDKNGIGTLEFYHPQSNSLPGELLNKIANKITDASSDEKVKVIIIKSSGNRVFCAGASFEELSSINNISDGKLFFSGFANIINACRKCEKLIIGRIQGKCVGGGVGLASAVDYCFATKFSAIKLSELALGIGPFVVGPAVERKIGLSAMSTLAINAKKWFEADWALQKGLFAEIFDNTEEMDQAVNNLALEICNYSNKSMKKLKKTFGRELIIGMIY